MVREKSCGAVVYSIINDEIKYLIVQMKLGHFGFPKGHIEKNETESQTATREIKEETGVSVHINTNFRKHVEYSPYDCIKEVVYFLASTNDTTSVLPQNEIKQIQWLTFEQAITILSYENDKNILMSANNFLKS